MVARVRTVAVRRLLIAGDANGKPATEMACSTNCWQLLWNQESQLRQGRERANTNSRARQKVRVDTSCPWTLNRSTQLLLALSSPSTCPLHHSSSSPPPTIHLLARSRSSCNIHHILHNEVLFWSRRPCGPRYRQRCPRPHQGHF